MRQSIALLLLLLCAPFAYSDEEPPTPREPTTVSVVFDDVPLVDALRQIVRLGNLDTVIDKRLDEDASIKDVRIRGTYVREPALPLLKVLALSNGLGVFEPKGHVIHIRSRFQPLLDRGQPRTQDVNGAKVSLEIKDATASEAVQQLALVAHSSIIMGPRVLKLDQRFSLRVEDRTILQALELIAARVGARAALMEYGIFKITKPRGAPKAPVKKQDREPIVVQTYDVSPVSLDEQKRIIDWADRTHPWVRIVSAEKRKDWVVYATAEEHKALAVRLKAAAYLEIARALKANTTRLRYFDVKDLVGRYDKLPARMRRLFPELHSVKQQNGILIVRGTPAQLQGVTRDIDKLRDPFGQVTEYAGRRSAEGEFKLPPPTEAEWERAARGPQTLAQRIESLHAEVRALRGEVRELRALLERSPRRAPK